ncbi:MAG: phosphotransferase [Planctomycetota bacterium]
MEPGQVAASGRREDALPRIVRIVRHPAEHPLAQANRIAAKFALDPPIEAYDFPEKGNIHQHTYLIRAGRGDGASECILQRLNDQVFTDPRSVMAAMIACVESQKAALAMGAIAEETEWEAISLVPTRGGDPYLVHADRRGPSSWRLMVRIADARTYKSLGEIRDATERLRIAEEAGRGLAIYRDLTAGMDVSGLKSPLPGYRDTRLYYAQLRSVLAGCRTLVEAASYLPEDPVVRESTQQHFLIHLPVSDYEARLRDPEVERLVELALAHEGFAMALLDEMAAGRIQRVAIHGDTKLDNFLFSASTGRVKALVDLDTIMPHTWLVDWGDMVRSLVNVAGEKEPDPDKVRVDSGIYQAVARGFLKTVRAVTPEEVERMVDAVQIIALELGVRFLADFIRGDSYFRLGQADPPDLNRTRARVQLTLFERLREESAGARRLVAELAGNRRAAKTSRRRR